MITGCLLFTAALFAQANPGMSTQTTREFTAVLDMGRSASEKQVSARSLSFEDSDDPTTNRASLSQHDPPRAARKAAEKAERLSKKGNHEEAAAEFRNALVIDPQYYEAANNLALELEVSGKGAEAETILRGLMQSAPEHVLAFVNLGTFLCQQHRYAEAEAVMLQAMKLHRFSFKTNFLLGAALIDQGKFTDEAKSELQYAQVKYPDAKALLDKWPAKPAAN